MEDSRASTSSQRLTSTFNTLLEGPDAEITAITVFRSEHLPAGSSGDITVTAQELVYVRKAEGVGMSAEPFDRDHELLS
ncbi:hypothetical protein O181_036254 [Austropuccinia psidii MF-1]|uniref:Uncharacterized protein n=1 Tax=Austropuccinia psidii MF-1 TaxID=1389203 RepID=A0A9Q3HBD1_9BASI|nr:hypothetical protein [Austropuccinia psidii MF-1]